MTTVEGDVRGIVVVGGGFAGVWSAVAAARQARDSAADLDITLVTGGDDLVIRPRLYQPRPEAKRVPLDRVLGPVGVRRVAATVTGVDTGRHEVAAIARDGHRLVLGYERLVLAAGSQLVRPELPGAGHLFDVDTLPAAAELDAHLHLLPGGPAEPGRFTAVVVGAGFTGLELATELVDRLWAVADPVDAGAEVRVVLVERAGTVGPELGDGPRPEILRALAELGVEVRLGVAVERLSATGVRLTDGTGLATRTVVWTAGMRANPLTADIPAERDRLGRLRVDEHLRVVGVPDVYAAGDTAAAAAQEGHTVLQSCQHASPQGRYAGHNAAADLLGLPPVPFAADPYVTCLDLGRAGALYTTGWERSVRLTGDRGKRMKRTINEQWIYPPLDDAEAILARSDLTASGRQRTATAAG
jgi:NADH dehydrogenase